MKDKDINEKSKELDRLTNELSDLVVARVEQIARRILQTHPNLNEFVMCMGTYFFTDKKTNDVISTYQEQMNSNYNYYQEDTYGYFASLNRFIEKYDKTLKITGNPMRFTATGKTIKNW